MGSAGSKPEKRSMSGQILAPTNYTHDTNLQQIQQACVMESSQRKLLESIKCHPYQLDKHIPELDLDLTGSPKTQLPLGSMTDAIEKQ